MRTDIFRRMSLVLTAALLVACGDAPSSPARPVAPRAASMASIATGAASPSAMGATREVQETLYDLSDTFVRFPCGDGYTEVVRLEGQVYERWTTVWDAAGGVHASLHTMPVGLRGVGLESGAEYRIAERESARFNQTPMAVNSRYELELDVHAPALGVRARLVLGGRYTINANGVVVVERERLRAECSQ